MSLWLVKVNLLMWSGQMALQCKIQKLYLVSVFNKIKNFKGFKVTSNPFDMNRLNGP